MDDLTNRNFQALAEGLKDQRTTNSKQDNKIKNLEGTVTQLQQELGMLQGRVAQILAMTTGTGPTAR